MSIVISWVGVDTQGVASAYIASDSRVSWEKGIYNDSCRRTFYSKKFPDIVGYCGDVAFPTMILQTLFDLIDLDIFYNECDSCDSRFEKFSNKVAEEISKYPAEKTTGSFELLYVAKTFLEKHPVFCAYLFKWNKGKIEKKRLKLPTKSSIIYCMGSGKKDFEEKFYEYRKNKSVTSRAIFQSLHLTLLSKKDCSYGGAPQIVGIYRKPGCGAFAYGIIYDRKRYYNGMEIEENDSLNNIEWRNELFERCDGIRKDRLPSAMKQPIF